MPRVKRGVAAKKRKNRILKEAKGYYGARSKLLKTAREAVEKGWKYSYRDRKQRKRQFRSVWIARINAATRVASVSWFSQFGMGSSAAPSTDSPNSSAELWARMAQPLTDGSSAPRCGCRRRFRSLRPMRSILACGSRFRPVVSWT